MSDEREDIKKRIADNDAKLEDVNNRLSIAIAKQEERIVNLKKFKKENPIYCFFFGRDIKDIIRESEATISRARINE